MGSRVTLGHVWAVPPSARCISLLCATIALVAGLFPVTARAQFVIADAGRARCAIVSSAGATPAERHAATELATILGAMTGATFAIRDTLPAQGAAIVVGPGDASAARFGRIDWNALSPDELIERTRRNTLLLAGGRPRGTLYAVENFLAIVGGARWWTPWATDLPHHVRFATPALNIRERPAFEYREPYWFPALNGEWAVRNRVNGEHLLLTPELGGSVRYHEFVHTFYSLVPPATYFATHPEWFSLVNGKRTSANAQLCLTNPALRDFVVAQVRAILRAEPDTGIVSISQNDCFGACECPNCKAIDDREGSHAGSVIDFVNYVADQIRPEFPQVAIDTLAYQYTRHAPHAIRPRSNVIVRLCSIECNFAAPLDDKSNAAFYDDLVAWSKLTNRLYVWDYTTNFGHYVQPQPNWFTLGSNLQLFARNHVKGVFSEGAYQSDGSEMAEMRAWVLAQLMWNPDQNADLLINEFLNGYYGLKAAPCIRRYLDEMRTAAQGAYVGCGASTDMPYLQFGPLRDAELLWQQAEAATADDPTHLWRVRQGHLPVRYVWLARWIVLRKEAARQNAAWPLSESRQSVAADWLAVATGPGPKGWHPMTQLSESGLTPQAFVAPFAHDPPPPGPPPARRPNPPAPEDIAGVVGGIDIQDDQAILFNEGAWAELRADSAASDGVAVWMPANHHEWATQFPVTQFPPRAQSGKWQVYVSIRVEPKPKQAPAATVPAFTAGIYDAQAQVSCAQIQPANAPTDDRYHTYRIGGVTLKPGQYIWIAPIETPAHAAIWVDRVYLVPATAP